MMHVKISSVCIWLLSFCLHATDCESQLENCDFYDCRERIQQCGAEGYMLSLAKNYCEQFMQFNDNDLSSEGLEWLSRVGQCLREVFNLIPVTTNCDETKLLAIASHETCYVETGFCQLSISDKWRVFEQVYRELYNREMRKMFLKIGKRCLFG